MEVRFCNHCGTKNTDSAWSCSNCGNTLSINSMVDLSDDSLIEELIWQCKSCGDFNIRQDACANCGKDKNFVPNQNQPAETSRVVETCDNCGSPIHPSLNHCTDCRKAFRASRLRENQTYPKVDTPIVKCFAAKQDETLVLATPRIDSERLYLLGPGEMLPIEREEEEYFCLRLPGNELGFVSKKSGIVVELGINEVKEPLGFARQNHKNATAEIVVFQPNGNAEIVGNLQAEERYPVVEESEDSFKIQMPNGLQGWVYKAYVLRTISPDSVLVSQKPSSEFANIVLGVAGLVAIGIIGGLVGDPEENRIRKGVDRALRDRGI